MSEEEQAGMRMRVAVPTRTVVFGLPLLAQVWGHQPATAGVELTGGALRASAGRPRLLVRCRPHTCG